MPGMTLLQICAAYTDADDLLEALRTLAKADSGVADGFEDSFALGVLAAYAAGLNRDAADQDDDAPRPLSDSEVDELLVNVSISKLEALLRERKAERADTPEEIRQTLEDGPAFDDEAWCDK